ncbi:adenosine trna methylthiotransferase [Colletotrichum asianum]
MGECVDTYMVRRASEIDSSWQISATNKLAEQRSQQQVSERNDRAQERTNSFWGFVKTFVKHAKREDLKKFHINGQHRWDDVKRIASEAIEKDAEKTRWRKNPFKAAGRSLQKSASNLEMLLNFLPNDGVAGVLCGALTFVFFAAKRLDEVRTKILACLESLPEIVEQTEAYVNIYDADPKVWSAAENLYIGILDGVERMLQWIDESAFERAFKSLLLPATFGAKLEEETIKKNINDKVIIFRETVQVNLHRRMGRQENALRTLQTQLNSLVSYAQWRHENPHAIVLFKTFINLNQLRDILDVEPRLVRKDVETATIDVQNACAPGLINHAFSMLRNERFIVWLQSNMSQILIINGGMQLNAEQEATSPLTLLSCFLSASVSQHPERSFSILHLCGQHNSPNDSCSGPTGIIRCLNYQLANAVTQDHVDLSQIDMNVVEGIKAQQPRVLCSLFDLLLSAAAGKAVFVIVDGISFMEEGHYAEQFGKFVEFLRDLVNNANLRRPGYILKVLLTNPSTSIHARRWLPGDCILEMEDVEDTQDIPGEAEMFMM